MEKLSTTAKLYKVKVRGFQGWNRTTDLNCSYVVASDPNEAYQKVLEFLNSEDLGFRADRELHSVELLAEKCINPFCKTILFL